VGDVGGGATTGGLMCTGDEDTVRLQI